jgi:hypothetical protein
VVVQRGAETSTILPKKTGYLRSRDVRRQRGRMAVGTRHAAVVKKQSLEFVSFFWHST